MATEDETPLPERTRVKVCGITRVDDALVAADLGADLLGLNFYPQSSRFLDLDRAIEIAAAVRQVSRPPKLVGVFVNQDRERVEDTRRAVGLDLVQLHGDESAAVVRGYGSRAIKALRVVRAFDSAAASPYLDPHLGGASPWGFLIDYQHPHLRGGSGRSWAFASLAGVELGRPVLIAGGLDPHTVRAAAKASGAWGVDVCSGVESSPGIKDRDLMARFFEEISHVTSAAAS